MLHFMLGAEEMEWLCICSDSPSLIFKPSITALCFCPRKANGNEAYVFEEI